SITGDNNQEMSEWLIRFNILCTTANIPDEERKLALPLFLRSDTVINWFIDTDLDHLS
ncbi:unnamed protein product, partial [Didymodactylos carnosus]